jgi:hypothetical protein
MNIMHVMSVFCIRFAMYHIGMLACSKSLCKFFIGVLSANLQTCFIHSFGLAQ